MERGEKENRLAKWAERGLGGEKGAGEPVHFVLIPPIHDIGLVS